TTKISPRGGGCISSSTRTHPNHPTLGHYLHLLINYTRFIIFLSLEIRHTCHIYNSIDKKFNICTKCNMIEATPQHLLDCVALVYDDLLKRLDFVLEVMRANDLMDLI
ncbi:hypothetical protein AVEN_89188-1, partial [Araneus ventricosus]